MPKLRVLLLLSLLLLVSQQFWSPAWSQGMAESGSMYGLSAGLGAGLAASSKNHSQVVRNSYKSLLDAQQATLAQTKAIEKYMSLGCQFELKKQWENAEKSFMYVLQVIARRDGPGSIHSVPALQHLVTVTKAENKINDAISYQKTLLAFAKSGKTLDNKAVLIAGMSLSNLYIQKEDYANAEPVLRDTMALFTANSSLPEKQKDLVRESYVNVLHRLHKDADADALTGGANNAKPVDDKAATITPSENNGVPSTTGQK